MKNTEVDGKKIKIQIVSIDLDIVGYSRSRSF
jgi:hypothetical protein